jgi:hypothetical protein
MAETIAIVGFLFAAYSIVANDAIQTLGTFLSSNAKRPWWMLGFVLLFFKEYSKMLVLDTGAVLTWPMR